MVLNGCRDDTLGVVRRLATEYPEIRLLDFLDPIGKGGALDSNLLAVRENPAVATECGRGVGYVPEPEKRGGGARLSSALWVGAGPRMALLSAE